jgi:hypothetical protein
LVLAASTSQDQLFFLPPGISGLSPEVLYLLKHLRKK